MEAQIGSGKEILILTLEMDEQSQMFFDRLRRQNYPAHLNKIAAHLTLFHKLTQNEQAREKIAKAAERLTFNMEVTGIRSLGHGVAYQLESAELTALHRTLAEHFRDDLSAQDQQKFWPHVVVQNKVTGESSKELKRRLEAGFSPFPVHAKGLQLWRYLGGPWALAEGFAFQAQGSPAKETNATR